VREMESMYSITAFSIIASNSLVGSCFGNQQKLVNCSLRWMEDDNNVEPYT
jgi:hypothetical protein